MRSGVIAVPHGSDYNWNERMRTGLAPLEEDYHLAHAFSMVDPVVIERAVRELEDQGVKAAVMVRIFSIVRSPFSRSALIRSIWTPSPSLPSSAFSSAIPVHPKYSATLS